MGKRLPSYRLHKPSSQAVVTIDGKDHYLGPFGSDRSRQKYGELIAIHASGRKIDPLRPTGEKSGITVNELCLSFLLHANQHYRKNGEVTDEVACFKSAIRHLVDLYGMTPAAEFGPLAMKAVRARMIESGWTRKFINKSVSRLRHVFRYGVENELVPAEILLRLQSIAPLLAGRTEAKDRAKRRPVPQDHIEQVKAIVPQRTRDLIDLQLLTGCRPGELIMLTGGMIDRTHQIWIAKLTDHKTAHHDKDRVLVFGPRAQKILIRYLTEDHGKPLFEFTRKWYGQAVGDACEKLNIPRFTPHWLRHNAASSLREEFGLDIAQIMLGHSSADVTQVYAHLNLNKALAIASQVG